MANGDKLKKLASELLLPELERQLKEEPALWPNLKGLFILTIAKKRKPMAVWYVIFLFLRIVKKLGYYNYIYVTKRQRVYIILYVFI